MEGAFHGRTYGALSVTYDEHYRAPFAPLLPNIRFVPVNDPAKLREAVSEKTAAIILEPIQGEGGVRPLTPEFAKAVNEVCAKTGALLIADEVQCGLGRTGYPFYFQKLGMKPDLVSVGKALAAGVPMGAALVKEEVGGRAVVRRPRQHVRRQSAGVPGGARVSRRALRRLDGSRQERRARISRSSSARWRRSIRRLSRFEAPA